MDGRNLQKRSKVDSEKYQLAKYHLPIVARETQSSGKGRTRLRRTGGRGEGEGGGAASHRGRGGRGRGAATAKEGGRRTLLESMPAFVGLQGVFPCS